MAKESGKTSIYAASNTFGKNKVKKLQRHLSKHPEDATAAQALKAHRSGVIASSRWGYKSTSTLSSSDRLHDQTFSQVKAGLNELRFLGKHSNVTITKHGYVSDQLLARDKSRVVEAINEMVS